MAPIDHAPPILPAPLFEGSEKRLEVDFLASGGSSSGLRALARPQLDELMTLAACTIVSSRSNDHFDAYVLSESSLFVYPTKWVLKTCGTTQLLQSVPRLLELAGAVGCTPVRCKYNRASYLFPEQQPAPHTSFADEVRFLDGCLGGVLDLGGRQARVVGDELDGLQWHVYVAGRHPPQQPQQPPRATFNIEVCMTELSADAAQQFYRTSKFTSAADTTRDTGIVHLKPGALIDDYVFEPCGYSMNGISKTGLITIHVTPEPGHSYASVEVSGYQEDLVDPTVLLAAAVRIFRPGKASLAISTDGRAPESAEFCKLKKLPCGYMSNGLSSTTLDCGGVVFFCTLALSDGATPSPPSSPSLAMSHVASSLSFMASSVSSDSEQELEAILGAIQ